MSQLDHHPVSQYGTYEAEPVGRPYSGVDPDWTAGLVVAAFSVFLLVRYLKVILLVLAVLLLAVLLVGLAEVGPLVAEVLRGISAER